MHGVRFLSLNSQNFENTRFDVNNNNKNNLKKNINLNFETGNLAKMKGFFQFHKLLHRHRARFIIRFEFRQVSDLKSFVKMNRFIKWRYKPCLFFVVPCSLSSPCLISLRSRGTRVQIYRGSPSRIFSPGTLGLNYTADLGRENLGGCIEANRDEDRRGHMRLINFATIRIRWFVSSRLIACSRPPTRAHPKSNHLAG